MGHTSEKYPRRMAPAPAPVPNGGHRPAATEPAVELLNRSLAPFAGGVRSGLIDPRFEHESCGVGFVASVTAESSHSILVHALTALARLAHRGAIAADGKSSDGIGIMTAVPREFLLRAAGIALPTDSPFGAGVLFADTAAAESLAEIQLAAALAAQHIEILAWRTVPIVIEVLGEIALSSLPVIRQVLVTADSGDAFERRLYLARKQFERVQLEQKSISGYVCSLSSETIVYKSLCAGKVLADFYPDLKNPGYVTPFALFHQRYATNVLPSWDRAQPLRALAQNGEINTVWGNRARMDARCSTLPAECRPILSEGGSDTTSLDETVELLAHNGRTLAEAVRMLLPPATQSRQTAFLRYHADCVEPWDGPAALAFANGRYVGAALDRNGLRPCRYAVTDEGLIVAGSEAGLVDMDQERVTHSGRLGPGQMLIVDLVAKRFYEDEELHHLFDNAESYSALLEDTPLVPWGEPAPPLGAEELLQMQRAFGYTREDLRMILAPMAADGKDAVWSMGDDTPLAFLAHSPRPIYAYFRQRFAQVTNPAIDPLRESCVLSMHTRLGPWPDLLDRHARLPGLSLKSPYLSLGQVDALRHGNHPLCSNLPLAVLDCFFALESTLESGIDELCSRALDLVRGGARILLLSDRNLHAQSIAIPMAMAVGAVHIALIRAGLRTRAGLAVEAGDCRDLHHGAVLIGMGAGAVCPWLALETARSMDPVDGERKMLYSFDLGLAKVMSKMGISVVDSYRSAHLFDILGLDAAVVDRCFFGTPSPISGIGFADIEGHLRAGYHSDADLQPAAEGSNRGSRPAELPDYGWVRFRKDPAAEPHAWQPPTVKALQMVVGSARVPAGASVAEPAAAWASFSAGVAARPPAFLRDLLEIRPAGPELAIEEVEEPKSIVKRFIASAMSLGSLSPEAHQTITLGMNMLGGRSNTGEGGEDPAVYTHSASTPASQRLDNKIKQVASGRFGVTTEYLANAEELEIKVAQGSKPGEGGQLPAHKVTELIARLRHSQPGVSLISPPPHHDIYSIEDLAQLIFDLKRVNPRARVGVKLVSGCGVGTVAAGVVKAYADYIVIAGHNGGTGASPLSSIKYAGNPWELGLAETQQVLMQNGLRGRVRLRADGGLCTARDVLVAALLGADEFAFGTSVLVALGCDMARQCHLNTCPTGIATQRPELRAKFRGKPEHVVLFFEQLAAELQGLLARLGLPSLEAAIGRADLLEQVSQAGKLDLSPLLHKVQPGAMSNQQYRNDRPLDQPYLDEEWVAPALAAVSAGKPFQVDAAVANGDRTLGARLAGELALLPKTAVPASAHGNGNGAHGAIPPVAFHLAGIAGQSFGAFAVAGMTLTLTGQANDFVGKGLSGGTLILRATGRAALDSQQHVILGNVALYGATAGYLYAAGRAGERFAVRNSGATAVIEGIGDHGCEYMTGGTVVVLGETGSNFGAGMTGGLAWVYDPAGRFVSDSRFHTDFLTAESSATLDPSEILPLQRLVEAHAAKSLSSRAVSLLAHWAATSQHFLRLTPKPQV